MSRPNGRLDLNDRPDDQNDELEDVTDEEAEQLLGAAVAEQEREGGDADDSEDSGEESSDRDDNPLREEIAKWKSLARKHEKQFKTTSDELRKYKDADKSESERLQERASTAESRAGTAEARAKALEIAMERAPEHATLAQVRAVAKRVRGDDDDELEADADELFELMAPKAGAKTPQRPKERLKGGAAPDEEPEETDPKKLAALIPRRS